MRILAIETSCDETSIAIIESKNNQHQILSNIVSSQIKIHSPYGGVVPSLAAREHQKNLIPVLKIVLQKANMLTAQTLELPPKARTYLNKVFVKEPDLFKNFLNFVPKIKKPNIDLIAVTNGPGLEIALWNGINFAKALSFIWKKPLIAVNHLEGHIYSNWLNNKEMIKSKIFPALNLIVSGGHTQLILMTNHGKYRLIGKTLDDAAGEAFDKVARMMNLGYPGGPVISKYALRWKTQILPKSKISPEVKKIKFPRPMIDSENYNFSFSGLKTSVLYKLKELKSKKIKLNNNIKAKICYEFQQAVVDVLVQKTIKAAKEFEIKSVLLSGGVSANKSLRNTLKKETSLLRCRTPKYLGVRHLSYFQPELKWTGDNAAMIAIAGYYKISTLKKHKTFNQLFKNFQKNYKNISANGNLKIKSWG